MQSASQLAALLSGKKLKGLEENYCTQVCSRTCDCMCACFERFERTNLLSNCSHSGRQPFARHRDALEIPISFPLTVFQTK